ncbi:unnamed protein product [Durusdinium trenchii]|uniref:Cytochrome b5 heme-binding domain-containing protein n=1 Tax=Durusdinium trenchii TaxID=1381693 RepID=A0ABP0MVW4_9DINO
MLQLFADDSNWLWSYVQVIQPTWASDVTPEGALATHLLRTAKEKGSITERALDKSAELKKTHKEHRKDGTPRREHSGKPGRKNSIRGLRKDASQQSITRGGSRRPKKVASRASASSVQLSTDGSIHLSPEQEAAQEEQRLKQEDAFRHLAALDPPHRAFLESLRRWDLEWEDAWMVLFGEVLDVTKFVPIHPGGEDTIHMYLGKDATEEWVEIHTPETLEKNLQHITKIGKIEVRRGLMTWLFEKVAGASRPASPEKQREPVEDDWPGGTKFTPAFEEELKALNGSFTLESLKRWNGRELPMLIGLCGVVIDVSPSENFDPNHGYGKLWGGKDCTWAMATVSLKGEDANRLDFKLQELEELQFKSLAGWYKHFTEKYRQVGTLEELKDWDWSSVITAAQEMQKTGTYA